MILDLQTLMSDRQAITATAASTNVIDLQAMKIPRGNLEAPLRDLGRSDHVPLLLTVVETFNTLTSLTIDIQTSDDPAFGSGIVTHSTTGAVLLANLKAGWRPAYSSLPESQGIGMKRYLRCNYTVAGTAPTLGRVTAGIVAGVQTNG